MKRGPEEDNSHLLQVIGKNAIECLNEMPLYCAEWIPLLQRLSRGTEPIDLAPFLTHGSDDNVRKSLLRVKEANEEFPLFQKPLPKLASDSQQEEARDFLIDSTREDHHNHRLYTADSLPTLYAHYLGTVSNPIGEESFTHVYHSLRILKERHCHHDLYTCPYCDDYYLKAKNLLERIDPNSDDYPACKAIYEKCVKHRDRWHIQTKCFYDMWNNPPAETLIIAEDAGKRFVLDGKGVSHVVLLRYRDNGVIHERHYFFCHLGPSESVSRYSIAHAWIALHGLIVDILSKIKFIENWHDGGTNEYNNSSGLALYGSLQRLWQKKFTTNCFIEYHGKGPWDGLLGSGGKIFASHASLVEILPNYHFNKELYYRALATIGGENAEVSEAYGIDVC